MIRSIFIFFGLFVSSLVGMAQTILKDFAKDTVLTKAGNPYFLKHDIIVAKDAHLQIEPGVKVYGEKNKIIHVLGKITIKGSEKDSVYFSVQNNQPADSNFYGINVEANAISSISFLKVSYAKRFLHLNKNAIGNIQSSTFTDCKTAIYADSGAICSIKKTAFRQNVIGIENITRAFVDSCTFYNNYFGVGFARACIISHCYFYKNSEKGFSGIANQLVYNQFLNHPNIALEASLENDLQIYFQANYSNNRFENNEIAFRIIGEIPIGSFANNLLCNNRLNVLNSTIFSPNLSKNCWCTKDSIKIRESIYDRYKNIEKGIVSYIPLASECDTSFGTYSINGKTISNAALHQIWLYKSVGGKDELILKKYSKTDFRIEKLLAADYKIMVIALKSDSTPDLNFLPSFYVKRSNLTKAFVLPLKGDFYDVHIELLPNNVSKSNSSATFRLSANDDQYVMLVEKEEKLETWYFLQNEMEAQIPIETGKYTFRLIGKNGEVSTSAIFITENATYHFKSENQQMKLIPFDKNNAPFHVFPTLVSDVLNVQFDSVHSCTVHILNAVGKEIFAKELKNSQNQIDVSAYTTGLYIVRLESDNESFTTTFVK